MLRSGSSIQRQAAPQPGAPQPAVPAGRKRSPWERALVWGFIGGLCFIALLELAGKMSYDRALGRLQKGLNEHSTDNPFTVESALARVNRPAEVVSPEGASRVVYEWRWPSLFKTYRIRVVASAKTRVIADLQTGPIASADPSEKGE